MSEKLRPVMIVSGGSVLQPILPALAARYDLVFLYPQLAQSAAEQGTPNVLALGQFFTADVKETADTATGVLTAQIVNAMPAIAQRIALSYNERERPHALNGDLSKWLVAYSLTRLQNQITTLSVLEAIFNNRDVAGCIVHEDLTPDARGAVLFCRARGVPTIQIPHAACHLLPGVEDIHRSTRTEYILASGEYMAKFYADGGHPPDKISIVGVPQWDSYYTPAALPAKAEARRVLGVDGLTLCYATTWAQTTSLRSEFERELQASLEAVLRAAKELGATLIVKMHPGENPAGEQYYAEQMKASGVYGMVTRNHMTYTTLAADVLIAQGPSNICIEAAMMGTPSCYIQTEGFDFAHALPYRSGMDGLVAAIEQARVGLGAGWDDFIRYYNAAHGVGDGAAQALSEVERICR